MVVTVNNMEVHLPLGMTVRHALIRANLLKAVEAGKKVYDEWENEMGLDGALWDGIVLEVR